MAIAPPSLASPPAAAPGEVPAPIAVPAPIRLRYDVRATTHGLPLSGKGELQWRHDGESYEARLEVSSALLRRSRVQRSTGRVTPEGLAPDTFSDRSRKEQTTHFDRERGRLVFSNNRPSAPLPEGTQDRLSVLLQLAALIGGRPERYPPGAMVEIQTAGTGDVEPWVFTVEGEEDLRLPGGTVRGLKLQRLPRKEDDQKVELWLAPRMDYAPVRVRLTNPEGDSVDQRWASTDRG